MPITQVRELLDGKRIRDLAHHHRWAGDRDVLEEVMALFHFRY